MDNKNVFEALRHLDDNGREYWLARELSSALGYSEYRNMKAVIEKAKASCHENHQELSEHFVDVNEMVAIGSGSQRKVADIQLSRYACLLIAIHADRKKEKISSALHFFAGKSVKDQMPDYYANTDLVFFADSNGNVRVELIFDGETLWTTQKRMAEIFEVDVRTISYHINQIFETNELNKYSVVQKNWITAEDGKDYETNIYNLDVIIAVGYRVNSIKATRFRQWATRVLSEYMRKGFVLDDERFKQGNDWSNTHFEQLLERIREIRASERMAYQKITDIYTTADDYQRDAEETRQFYAKVQNKLHWAITGKTAAEIIYSSADSTKPHMGLQTWGLAPEGKVLKTDVAVAKNYLSEEHLKELNQIVSAYLDLAENRARRHISTTMKQWAEFLDHFLELSSYPILLNKGSISSACAKIKAYEEYKKFRVIQDREYISDFDKEVEKLKEMSRQK